MTSNLPAFFLRVCLSICVGWLALMLVATPWTRSVQAQEGQAIDVTASVEILNDNRVKAREEAIAEAQKQLILESIREWADPILIETFADAVVARLLEFSDHFIDQTRVVSEARVGQEYQVTLRVKLFTGRLLNELKRLGIPMKIDEPKPLHVLIDVDDQAFQQEDATWALEILGQSLAALKLPLASHQAIPVVRLPDGQLPEEYRGSENIRGIFLFNVRPDSLEEALKQGTGVEIAYRLYQPDGTLLSRDLIRDFIEPTSYQKGFRTIVERGLNGAFADLSRFFAGSAEPSYQSLIITGLDQPNQERFFIQHGLINHPFWDAIQLRGITAKENHYRARYLGPLDQRVSSLKQLRNASFRVRSVEEKEGTLHLNVEWEARAWPPVPFQARPPVSQWLKEGGDEVSRSVDAKKQVGSSELPHDEWIYDFIRNRGDRTLFQASLTNEASTLVWKRLGPTRLDPIVKIFDQEMRKIAEHHLGNRSNWELALNFPNAGRHIYVQISDRIGYLPELATSFNFLHYLIKVQSASDASEAGTADAEQG